MTPFKQAQRAQALYDDPQLPRRDLADMTARLESENEELRKLCADIYKRFRGVVFECWAYSSEDFRMYEQRMRELGVRV